MVAALVAILAPATAAAAAPTPEEIDKQISAQEDKLEQVVEAYNKINIELAGSQAQAQQANDQMTVLVGRLADARTQTDEIAVMAKGVIVHRSETLAFRRDPATAHRLLGVDA